MYGIEQRECWNYSRSFPWSNELQERLADRPVQIVGVHLRQLERERDYQQVVAKMEGFGLHHPVMVDNDYAFRRSCDISLRDVVPNE
jgi:hypothetical protein